MMKKVFAGTFIFVLLLSTGCSDMLFVISNVQREISQNGKYEAIVFQRNGGATVRESFHLTISKANKTLKNKPGNAYVSYSAFDVEWKDDRTLYVNNQGAVGIFKQEKEIDGIQLEYAVYRKE